MSRVGDCRGKEAVENWNDKLNQKPVFRTVFSRKDEVSMPLFYYIEDFYTHEGLHSPPEYMTQRAVVAEYFVGQRDGRLLGVGIGCIDSFFLGRRWT